MSDSKARNAAAPAGANRRELRDYYESKDRKKTRLIALLVTAALLVLFAGALFINSGLMRRTFTAMTVGSTDFSAVDFNYFYQRAFTDYQNTVYQNMPDMATSLLPNSSKPHKSQIYNEETGETWAEFIAKMAVSTMEELTVMYEDAVRNGYTLPDDVKQKMDEEMETLRSTASMYGMSSLNKYLSSMFGSGMNEKAFRRLAEITYVSDSYSEYKRDEFSYSDEQLNEYYESKKDTLDTFTYRYFLYRADMPEESDFEDDAAYEEASQQAVDEAGARAAEILSGISDEQGFTDAAAEYSPEEYGEEDSTKRVYMGELLGSIYGPWLRESTRKYGDVTTVESSNGHYLVFFIDRSDNAYPTVDMRRLLVGIETVNEEDYADDETGETYNAAVELAVSDAKTKADTLYGEWGESKFTDEKLLELIPENSSDTAENGLYENVYRLQLDAAVNDWLFEPDRAPGDHELIESDSGFNLVYYIDQAELYRDYLADTRKRDEDFNAWKESLGKPEAQRRWAYRFALEMY
ncbi:MAG: hypothetical protein LBD92_02630 [Oscillospiraceae bacterium]|jgi:hypothetical protein|nr:hypothetical protein [Oscillospiraceae bacterium]